MRAAGIRRYSAPVELLELPGPGQLRPDEVLLEVRFAGVGNWDEIARTGGWDLGRHPPMALGVEAGGIVARAGAADVLDHRSPDWPRQVRELTAGRGVDLAVNAAPGGAATALETVRNGGRLATITSDPPDAERGIEVRQVYVAPDGPRLARLAELLAAGTIGVTVSAPFPLEHAARALDQLKQGTNGQALVLQPT